MSSSDRPGPNVGHSARPGTEGDPTGTYPIQDRYGGRLRGRYDELKGEVREYVEENDRFGFADDGVTDEAAIAALVAWLLERSNQRVLGAIGPDRNPFVQSGFERGVRNALRELRDAPGFDLEASDAPEARRVADGGQPRQVAQEAVRGDMARNTVVGTATVAARKRLSDLKARSYRRLRAIAGSAVEAVRTRLTGRSKELKNAGKPGLTNRRQVTRIVNRRLDAKGRTPVTRMARSETVRAHSEGAITTAERTSVRAVTIRAEWLTAGDRRVCPICAALEGTRYRTANVRTGTFKYEAGPDEAPSLTGVYPVMPPAHPQCRCALIPSIPVTASQPQPYGGRRRALEAGSGVTVETETGGTAIFV